MTKDEEYWYCLGCRGWGNKVADEPNIPTCYPSHKIIKVLGNSRVAIKAKERVIFS